MFILLSMGDIIPFNMKDCHIHVSCCHANTTIPYRLQVVVQPDVNLTLKLYQCLHIPSERDYF